MKKKSSQRGSLRLTSDKAERLRAFREGPADDSSRRPRQEPAHVVLARAQASEAERLRRARAPKPPKPEQALALREPEKEEPSQALVAIENEAKAKRDA